MSDQQKLVKLILIALLLGLALVVLFALDRHL
jgi:hypothetical protein